MSELIKREDAIKITWQEPQYYDPINALTEVREKIRALPTVDAVPVVHSAWKHEIEDMGIFRHHTVRCLNCKCGFTHAYVVLLCGDTGDLFKHCPNCGAKMKGEQG